MEQRTTTMTDYASNRLIQEAYGRVVSKNGGQKEMERKVADRFVEMTHELMAEPNRFGQPPIRGVVLINDSILYPSEIAYRMNRRTWSETRDLLRLTMDITDGGGARGTIMVAGYRLGKDELRRQNAMNMRNSVEDRVHEGEDGEWIVEKGRYGSYFTLPGVFNGDAVTTVNPMFELERDMPVGEFLGERF